ncbi:hypothetical protein EIP86_010787 [Pleurotus ostreatoroseus]|nr:hypothetical protein EIP86_010787 [Pleurotus ostreatoroseus]
MTGASSPIAVVPRSIDGHEPPRMPPQPPHLHATPWPTVYGPGFVRYRDPRHPDKLSVSRHLLRLNPLAKTVCAFKYGCYMCTLDKGTITHVNRIDRHMIEKHLNALKRHWLVTGEALQDWLEHIPRYECPEPNCGHKVYRRDEFKNHYMRHKITISKEELAVAAKAAYTCKGSYLQCAEAGGGYCGVESEDEEEDDYDATPVDRRIDEDYDGDADDLADLELAYPPSDTDDPGVDNTTTTKASKQPSFLHPSSHLQATQATSNTRRPLRATPTNADDMVMASETEEAGGYETDDNMSIMTDGEGDTHMAVEHLPNRIPIVAPIPRRAQSASVDDIGVHISRREDETIPRAAVATPPEQSTRKRAHSAVESPGRQSAPVERQKHQRVEEYVYRRRLVYDLSRDGSSSAPANVQAYETIQRCIVDDVERPILPQVEAHQAAQADPNSIQPIRRIVRQFTTQARNYEIPGCPEARPAEPSDPASWSEEKRRIIGRFLRDAQTMSTDELRRVVEGEGPSRASGSQAPQGNER